MPPWCAERAAAKPWSSLSELPVESRHWPPPTRSKINAIRTSAAIVLLGVLVPSAVIGLLTVAVAVTVHEFAEIIAVLNGLRARSLPVIAQRQFASRMPKAKARPRRQVGQ